MEENNFSQTPVSQSEPVINQNSKLDIIKQLIWQFVEKIKSHPFIANMNPQIKKIAKVLFIGLGVFFILLVIVGIIFSSLKNRPKTVKSTPTPQATNLEISLDEEIRNPSPYATDSAVLKIEGDVRKLDNDLSNTSLKDSDIWPPDIKFDVNFGE